MAQITRVGALDGNSIDIHLSNGSAILLEFEPFLNEARFRALLEDDRILYPKTDGDAVFWRDGPRLSLAEIMELIQQNNRSKEEQV